MMDGLPRFPRHPDPLRFWRRISPDRLALVDRPRGERLTYAELDAAADRWAGLLRARGIGRGAVVAALSGNRRELPELFFACGRIGAALLPLNWRLSAAELKPILADLIAFGKREGAHRPWIGVYAREMGGHVVVAGVAEGGPAAAAGLAAGDLVLAVNGQPVTSLAEFYRRIWSLGDAGVGVPLQVTRGARPMELRVHSIDRLRWLKLNQSY